MSKREEASRVPAALKECCGDDLTRKPSAQPGLRRVIGTNITRWRTRMGYPLKYIACELDVSVAICCKWERGNCYPSAEHLVRLAALFGTSPACLLCPHYLVSACTAKGDASMPSGNISAAE